jgi:DNA-binding protein HU-beta
MTRADLARKVYSAHGGMTYASAQQVVEQVLEAMMEGICTEGRLVVSGFGTFRVVKRKARTGRDLSKGRPVSIPERNTVVFVPSRQWLAAPGAEPPLLPTPGDEKP